MPVKDHYSSVIDINIDDYFISDIDIVLIPTIPGRHSGLDIDKYGYRKVNTVLQRLVPKLENPVLTYQTSSVGNLSEQFFREFLSGVFLDYMTVDQLRDQSDENHNNTIDLLSPSSTDANIGSATSRVRMIFPTKKYVQVCNEGPKAALGLVLNVRDYKRNTFPKDIFYQFQPPDEYPYQKGVLPHLKVFFVTEKGGEITDDSYIYFGSHNFSAAAWGKYENNYTKMSMFNTELGILVPPEKGNDFKEFYNNLIRIQKQEA